VCGVIAIAGAPNARNSVEAALERLHHRGPDSHGIWVDAQHGLALGHARLRIIDLSSAASQPMTSADGQFTLAFNGEIYNYLELRRELAEYPYRSRSDTEVLLAAWSAWGEACLDRLLGMFAFVLWDARERTLVAVRDRFGVKPLYVATREDGALVVGSEIKAIHAAGLRVVPDHVAWASYLARGITDQTTRTFWSGISAVPAGTILRWRPGEPLSTRRWYDLAARSGSELDTRDVETVKSEYRALLEDAVRLRFRSDVPVGINVSGGLDSSLLLGLVHAVQGDVSDVNAFTFTTGDPAYDELPWVQGMLERTHHPLIECRLDAGDVPELAARITSAQDEPFGGLPTLAYANVFARARREGVVVLLDGQGVDEQWAGYDYYRTSGESAPTVQGSKDPATRPDCLTPELTNLAETVPPPNVFADRLRNLQLRDAIQTKLPRALRYNDRISMAASTELREPFLDHRLFELALRQPADRKIRGDAGKWLVRELAAELLPDPVRLAPKRALQTPQREWLRGPLRRWANDLIEDAWSRQADWFDVPAARAAWTAYQAGAGDNSYWVWQWLSVGLLHR
jgi:asparagine synthase (glutamine-hydrolysing)